jgi:ABC-type oligopeptide transport system ATPase subunit
LVQLAAERDLGPLMHPKLIIADEPVSALDVPIRAQVINPLDDLQDELHLTYVFIAHDLGVVRHVSDRIAVMYLGKIVEVSPAEELYQRPVHPYTEGAAVRGPDPGPGPVRPPDPDRARR